MSPPEECKICHSASEGHHFGVVTCKACAAFFRRSIAESKNYTCRYSGNCDMSQSKRNQCRACRLQKCHLLGMKRDDIPEAPVPEPPQTLAPDNFYMGESGSVTPPLPGSPPSSIIQFPTVSTTLLHKMSQFYQNFLSSQKSLYKINNLTTSNILQTDFPFKQGTIEIHNSLEKANASLIASMLHDYFPYLRAVDKDHKRTFFGMFAVRFISFQRGLLTAKFLSDTDLVAIQYGYYCNCSLESARIFFGDIDRLSELVGIVQPVTRMIKNIAQKISELNLTEMEIGGIVGAIFYAQLSQTELWNDERLAEYDESIVGMHNYLLSNHGVAQGGVRFARLLSLLLDLEKMISQSTNMQILSNFVLADNKQFADMQDSFLD